MIIADWVMAFLARHDQLSLLERKTSQENETLMTTLAFVLISGNTAPSAFEFPRVHLKKTYSRHCTPLMLSVIESVRTNQKKKHCLKHFIAIFRCSPKKPYLLTIDNYKTHTGLTGINLALEDGVHIVHAVRRNY